MMNWDFMVVLVLAIPVFVFPAFLWYLDIGGSYAALWKGRKRRAISVKGASARPFQLERTSTMGPEQMTSLRG